MLLLLKLSHHRGLHLIIRRVVRSVMLSLGPLLLRLLVLRVAIARLPHLKRREHHLRHRLLLRLRGKRLQATRVRLLDVRRLMKPCHRLKLPHGIGSLMGLLLLEHGIHLICLLAKIVCVLFHDAPLDLLRRESLEGGVHSHLHGLDL